MVTLEKRNDVEKALGFTSFNAYLAAPIESGGVDFGRVRAYEFIELHERYRLKLGIDVHTYEHINHSKLIMLLPIINYGKADTKDT